MTKISVFCSSRFDTHKRYLKAFNHLADIFISKEIDMIYGGANVGYMKVLADRIAESNQKLIGVMPKFLIEKELVYPNCDEFVTVESLPERIQKIAEIADGFVIMPGGVGTYEELMDMLSWSQVGLHQKPTVVMNVDGFYDGFLRQLQRGIEDELISASLFNLVQFTDHIDAGMEWLITHKETEYWDLYDEKGKKTAIVHPRGVALPPNHYHKITFVLIMNDQKELLLQKRSDWVRHPNLWGFSAGGAVVMGETSTQGATRELYEELGVQREIKESDWWFSFTSLQTFIDVYLINENIVLSSLDFSISGEVSEAKWVSTEELKHMVERLEFKGGTIQETILEKYDEKFSKS